jgi:hypothetical protein
MSVHIIGTAKAAGARQMKKAASETRRMDARRIGGPPPPTVWRDGRRGFNPGAANVAYLIFE